MNLAGPKQLILIGLILLAASGTLAGTTGKIKGRVTDAKTGVGLPGANVIVVGANLRVVTDLDGWFVIVPVPPGIYTLEASFVGYKKTEKSGVRVIQDLSTTIDFKLELTTVLIGDTATNFRDSFADSVEAEAEPPLVESSQLKGTVIAAHLEEAIPKGKNVIYCSTIQLAWNVMTDEVIKEKIHLEGNPPIAKALNKQLTSARDLSEDCYVAMAGQLTEEFLRQINKTLKAKFGDQSPPEVKEPIPVGPPRFMAYAYLLKNLEFQKHFVRSSQPLHFRHGDQEDEVVTFGIEPEHTENRPELANQVQVFDYRGQDQCIIGLKSKSEAAEIILAKVKPLETLLKTIEYVNEIVNKSSAGDLTFQGTDELAIPIIDFNVNHTFSELSGKRLMNKNKEDWTIGQCVQGTRFRLNEKGAFLKSTTKMIFTGGFVNSRQFYYDKPFLICLKQKGAKHPYFAMWVGNTELMVKKK